MKYSIFILTATTMFFVLKACCLGSDEDPDAYIYFTVVDNQTDKNILIGKDFQPDSIFYYNKNLNGARFEIDDEGMITYKDYRNNSVIFLLSYSDTLRISYQKIQTGYKDKNNCFPDYFFKNFTINNDTICSDCSKELINYYPINKL